jgi:hypothetical protein
MILGFIALTVCAVLIASVVCMVIRYMFGHGDDPFGGSCAPSRAQVLGRGNPYHQPVAAPAPQQITIINNHYYAAQPAPQRVPRMIVPQPMPETWPDGEPVEVWPDLEPAWWPS